MTGADPRLAIEVFPSGSSINGFKFYGSQIFSDDPSFLPFPDPANFHVFPVKPSSQHEAHSLQAVDSAPRPYVNSEPFFTLANTGVTLSANGVQTVFNHLSFAKTSSVFSFNNSGKSNITC
jgi:hypothetical protein